LLIEQSACLEEGEGGVGEGDIQLVRHINHALARLLVANQENIADVAHLRRSDGLVVGQAGDEDDVILQNGQDIAHEVAGEASHHFIFQMGLSADEFPINTCKNIFEFHR